MANALKTRRRGIEDAKGKSDAAGASSAIYLYGVSSDETAARPRRPGRLIGVDGVAPVESAQCAGLVCWISRVDRGNYADRLAQNMENLDWLAAASVRHQRVVGTLAGERDVLPARFGTVFLREASLQADIKARKKTITAALTRIAGAEEWGVKVFVEPSANSAPTVVASAATGREYLKQKATMLQQRARLIVAPEIGQLKDALRRVALDSVVAARPASGQPGLVWQAAFLVKRSATKRFHSELARFAGKLDTARIETSGPWPPYSFVHGPAERDGASPDIELRRRPAASRKDGAR